MRGCWVERSEAIWSLENIFPLGGSWSVNLCCRGSLEAGLAWQEYSGGAQCVQDDLGYSRVSTHCLQGKAPAAWRGWRPRFAQVSLLKTKSVHRKYSDQTKCWFFFFSDPENPCSWGLRLSVSREEREAHDCKTSKAGTRQHCLQFNDFLN